VSLKIYKPISFMTFFLFSINSFSSTGIAWFDEDLDECYEAIEKGKFIKSFSYTGEYINPYTNGLRINCRTTGYNSFYDEKIYSLNRVIDNSDNHYNCDKMLKSSYGFCEYAKFEDVKGVRPVP